jgi:hypothetical protein
MPLTLNGTTGVAGVDGSAGTPALQGADTNTGIYYGADTVFISTGGTVRATVENSGLTLSTPLVFPAGTVSAPSITTTGDTNTGIYFPAADTIGFVEGGVESMLLDASGNLGLGVTPSAWGSANRVLEMSDGYASFSGWTSDGSVNVVSNAFRNSSNSWVYKNSFFASRYTQVNSEHRWFTAPSGTAGNAISFTQAMTLDASGNLGIGTSSPGTKLNVYTGSATNTLIRPQNTLGYADFGPLSDGSIYGPYAAPAAATNLTVGTSNANPIRFLTDGSERARIDANGNIICGTAAIATNATNGFLYVPGCAGTPTGTPTTVTGRSPIVVDTTNNKLYFYSGGQWRDAGP